MHPRTDPKESSRRNALLLGLVPTLAAALCILLPARADAQATSGAPSAEALADSLDTGITRAAHRGDLDRLEELRLLAERAVEAFPNERWFLYYEAYALHRLGTLYLSLQEDEDRADRALEEAQALLEGSVQEDPTAEDHALLSGVLGLRISVNPMIRGISMGPAADHHIEAALELDRHSPRVWLMQGISAYNTPGVFGGSTDRAQRHLERSVTLFGDHEPESTAPSWGEAEARAWLGQVYAEQGDTEKATTAYRDALRIEPEYRWVRQVLLPRVAGEDADGG